ncbi:MAG: riboflavin kinase, partial [Planctomycetota bacterium]
VATVSFLDFLREVRQFDSTEALQAAIQNDIDTARRRHATR